MGLVLLIAAVIWGAGIVTRTPVSLRLWGIAVVWLGVVLAHLVLPEGHALRARTGGSAAPWLMLGGFVVLAGAYRWLLKGLRTKAQLREVDAAAGQTEGPFRDAELRRYARHIVLREVGGPGQVKLKQAKILVIGAGGLGSPALMYLAAAGVGTIGVIDDDAVDGTNLQRQVIHGDADIGRPKAHSAADRMRAINPFIEVRPYARRLIAEEAEALIGDYDLVLDGTDNFDTRYLANRVCVALGKPLISGALTQWEGQVSVFDPAHSAPCYQCVFPEAPAPGLAPSCAEAGVIGPLPGVVGSMMAVEAVKVITGAGAALRGEMMIYDALWGESRKIRVKPRADCPVCHGAGLAEAAGKA
ncbi:HesA/MoeB/ThiF family protein [Pseudooceanicola onchidii]|uniref:HesA/MoeB/ThiF family protein n=1 Tax=Pseudooceanicola onchidii TaxID=2562279 RepID=UPI0010AA190A|nr:HesA/MoeB/ThiF family protein [Pseudooceanicola onchidii]